MKITMTITEFRKLVEDVQHFTDLDITKLTLEDVTTLQDMLYVARCHMMCAEHDLSEERKQKIEELLARAERRV